MLLPDNFFSSLFGDALSTGFLAVIGAIANFLLVPLTALTNQFLGALVGGS